MENALSSRELAMLLWLAVLVVGGLAHGPIRKSLGHVAESLGHPIIVVTFVFLTAYVGLLILIGHDFLGWQPRMAKNTAIWFLGTAVVLVIDLGRVWKEERFFRQTARDAVAMSVALAVVVNLCVFSLGVELVFLPAITMLALLSAAGERRPEFAPVKRVIDGLLGLVGIGLLLCGAVRLVQQSVAAGPTTALEEFLLHAALTTGLLPFLYLIAMWAAYQDAFMRIRIWAPSRATIRDRRRARLAVIVALHLRVRAVGRVSISQARDAADASSFRAAWRIMRAEQPQPAAA